MEGQKKINSVSCEFRNILRNCNDSSLDQLEFCSLESNCLMMNTKSQNTIKDSSYGEAIKAFVKKINDRNNKSIDENNIFSKVASSTPFKKCDNRNSFNISGINNLELTSVQKRIGKSDLLNDSDFESMDQDQYDDDENSKENVNLNSTIDKRNVDEIVKMIQIKKLLVTSSKSKKSFFLSIEKSRKCTSPYKGRKNKLKKLKQIKNCSQTYLKYEQSFYDDHSLANIITTDSIKGIENEHQLSTSNKSENDDFTDFAFTQPNKTESFEASIKNLTQLSSSKQSQNDLPSSSFKRWGQSSLRARQHEERPRPSSLTASESDVYTKIVDTDSNKDRFSYVGPTVWGTSFELLLNDQSGLKIFAEFLKKEFSGENIYFWTACERYRQIADEVERRKEAIAIYEKHLANGALEPVNVDCNARNSTRDGLSKANIDLFASAQKQIFNLMKFDSYQRFIRSDLYKNCIQAERKNTQLPYATESLDPLLKITVLSSSQQNTNNNIASKLKKSLSNAEDRRRKSLLPWHRRTRCKSKDREEDNKKNSTSSSNTLKHNSNHSGGDIHSSRSSLSSFDAAIAKISTFDDETRNSLCRVILKENGATTIVQIKHDETVRELVERVLDKRGFSYQAYEVFLSGTTKPLNLDVVSKELAGNEVFIEQRVVFKLDLPNRKVISVKSKPCKLLYEVLRPILHKYSYRLDMVHLFSTENNDFIDIKHHVTTVDGLRLQILFKNENSSNNKITDVGQKPILLNFDLRNAPVTFVRAHKLVSSISNPQLNTLDEITNKVFNEVLQCKSTDNEMGNETNRIGDQGSIKSEDFGSETETSSGIFNRIRRQNKKSQKAMSKSSAGSEEIESDINGIKKPLIAKWKAGNQKLQVNNNRSTNDESLLENLKRAQCLRIEDQRGTDINFELPEFLKDRNKFGQKLRKTTQDDSSSNPLSLYSNVESLSPNRNDYTKLNISPSQQQKPPQPLPRTSLGKSPIKSSLEISSVQSKINSLENAILMNSRSNTPINLNLSTQCMPVIKSRHSDDFYSTDIYGDTTMVFNHRDFKNNEIEQKPPKLPPKRNFYKITEDVNKGMLDRRNSSNDIPYLDEPTSSFV